MKSHLFRIFFGFAVMILALGPMALTLGSTAARAQSPDPFENGWTLDAAASQLRFMSVKKGNVAETSSFATLSGLITEQGLAQIRILLDSVDTRVDLRNVRMRFLFFETFLHPEATVTAQLDPLELTDLHEVRRKVVDLDFAVSLHGVTVNRTAQVAVTLIDNDRAVVSTTAPLALTLPEFDLDAGRQKLEEAAGVTIMPVGIVSFDFVFNRASPGTPPAPETVTTAVAPGAAALETRGDLDREACIGRFEILSRTGNIYFPPASARLDNKSRPLLDNLHDIVSRCPGLVIEVSGHTDSDGGTAANQRLSERRAASVAAYLSDKGIAADRMRVVGHGEDRPLLPNTSAENKARNRRIEFSVVN